MPDTFVAFAIITTGNDPENDGIVEIAGVKFGLGKEAHGKFYTIANPGCPIPDEVTQKYKIDSKMVVNAPDSYKAITDFMEFALTADYLVSHNAKFDCAFIHELYARMGVDKYDAPKVINTFTWAERRKLELDSYTLTRITEHFSIPYYRKHRSGGYAQATALLFLRLVSIAKKNTYRRVAKPFIDTALKYDIHAPVYEVRRRSDEWKNDPVSERQIAYMQSLGVPKKEIEAVSTKGEASAVLAIYEDLQAQDDLHYANTYRDASGRLRDSQGKFVAGGRAAGGKGCLSMLAIVLCLCYAAMHVLNH